MSVDFVPGKTDALQLSILGDDNDCYCERLINSISTNHLGLDKIENVTGVSSGLLPFGLTKDYRSWNEKDYVNAYSNFKLLKHTIGHKDLNFSCLAHFAASQEAGNDNVYS